MVEIGLNLKTGRMEPQEKEQPWQAQLGETGVHAVVDARHDTRVAHNVAVAKTQWTDKEIDDFKWMSNSKKNILRRVNRVREYLEENVPQGLAVEKPKLSAAVVSMNQLILMTEDLSFSDTPDQDAVLLANDYLHGAYVIAAHTFNSRNVPVTKAWTINTQGQQTRQGEVKVVPGGSEPNPTV